jgi:acetyl-CoA synthetase
LHQYHGLTQFGELPKTISGKIRRVELRRAEAARTVGDVRRRNEYWEEDLLAPGGERGNASV